jgi:hypothetical protein
MVNLGNEAPVDMDSSDDGDEDEMPDATDMQQLL